MRNNLLQLLQEQGDLSIEQIVIRIVAALALGFLIYLSYAITHRGTIYSRKFNVSLIMLAVLTGTVMIVIANNIALSLGMVGALSIVHCPFSYGYKRFQRYDVFILVYYRRYLLRCRQLFCSSSGKCCGIFHVDDFRSCQKR